MDSFFTLAEVVMATGFKLARLRYQIRHGHLKAKRVGGKKYITSSELRRFLGEEIFNSCFDGKK